MKFKERQAVNLIDAVINNDVKQVRYFLEQNIDPNVYLDDAKITPLHFAAQNNSLEVVPLLVTAGANLNARIEPEGYTPLQIAELHQNAEMAALLRYYANIPFR